MPQAAEPLSLIERLGRFNAKERYWLVREALGHFEPRPAFVRAVAAAIGVDEPPAATVYAAMDYHLNWLWAALTPHTPGDGMPAPRDASDANPIRNNQEDVDLLLAWERADGVTQLVLVEAKCTTRFTREQLTSKLQRFRAIRHAANLRGRVDIKLLLISPPGTRPQTGWFDDFAGLELGNAWLALSTDAWPKEGFWVVIPGEADSTRWLACRPRPWSEPAP